MNGMSMERCRFDPDRLVHRLDMTLPGDVKAIAPAVRRVMEVVHEMGCATRNEFEIELALTEAIANAVVHGCAKDPGKTVELSVECDPERGMIVMVRDPGEGFDLASVPNPVVGERVYQESGRGIYLINRLMDEVRFEKGGTEIWMVKR
jgi:serine/threonine-protein kinase RsbW